jgi:tetratricopeptide (TPR) repeat protein
MWRPLVAAFSLAALLARSDSSADLHFRRGVELAARGDLNAAEQEYLAGLKISPQPAAYNNLGVLYFQKQDFPRAASAFGSAHELQPNDPEIAFNLGLALYKSGRTSEAIPPLIAGAASSHAIDAHYLLGACYYSQKQWEKSIAELERFRSSEPNRPQALFILALAYRYAGKPAASLDAASLLLKSHPESPFTHELLAEAYDKDGQPDKAIAEFQKAIAASPQIPELHFMLGYVCWRWKRYDQAIVPLEEEVRINPGYAAAYYYLGDIALRQNDNARALRYFQQTLRLDPSYREAELGLGKIYFKTGQFQDAVAALEKAKPGLDDTTELHYWLGRALIEAGRQAEGRQELARVSKLNQTQHRKMEELLNGVPVGERQQTPFQP